MFSARVGQAESVLAYAAVADLLRDIDAAVLAELSDVQRVAVDRVLLRASSEDHTTDQHVVAAAFAAVFDRLAADSPVLIAIDDLQWLDRSSKDVLAFAARRFKGGSGCCVTERSDAEGGNSVTWLHLSRPDRIERVRVGPLSMGGLHMLISSRLGRSFPRPTMVRIAEISGGNPFFALELARAIDIGSSQCAVQASRLAVGIDAAADRTAGPRSTKTVVGRRIRRRSDGGATRSGHRRPRRVAW